jgi:hypothetical protein
MKGTANTSPSSPDHEIPAPRAASRANYKLWFDDFKRKLGCNRPMGCLSEPKGDGGIAADRLDSRLAVERAMRVAEGRKS